MQQLAHQALGVVPRGIWLTERVWEPSLPALLAPLGIEYTFVDDHHFSCAGFEKEDLGGYYVVEKHGHAMKVFPISSHLRYLIPFQPLDDVFEDLEAMRVRRVEGGGSTLLTCLDDGEKFGLWPDTSEWVFDKGWLDGFLSGLAEREETLRTSLPSEILDSPQAPGSGGAAHLQLPGDDRVGPAGGRSEARRVLQGGVPLGARGHHPRRLLGQLLHQVRRVQPDAQAHAADERTPGDPGVRGGAATKTARWRSHRARLALMMGQCNDAYWHGLFGGLYFPFLRAEVYKQLINADRSMDELAPLLGAWTDDFDLDGRDEWTARTMDQMVVVKPHEGGCVYLWEDHGLKLNLTDVLTRREEAYHDRVKAAATAPDDPEVQEPLDASETDETDEADEVRRTIDEAEEAPATIHDIETCKEEGLHERLLYDDNPRMLGRTFVVAGEPDAESFRRGTFEEVGAVSRADFEPISTAAGPEARSHRIALTADLGAELGGGTIHKSFAVAADGVSIEGCFWLEDAGEKGPVDDLSFCVELNLTINALDEHRRIRFGDGEVLPVDGQRTADGERSLIIEDVLRPCSLRLESDLPARMSVYPVETVSASESGFERIFQGICVTLGVPMSVMVGGRRLKLTATRD